MMKAFAASVSRSGVVQRIQDRLCVLEDLASRVVAIQDTLLRIDKVRACGGGRGARWWWLLVSGWVVACECVGDCM